MSAETAPLTVSVATNLKLWSPTKVMSPVEILIPSAFEKVKNGVAGVSASEYWSVSRHSGGVPTYRGDVSVCSVGLRGLMTYVMGAKALAGWSP